jgi:hypothetical protein
LLRQLLNPERDLGSRNLGRKRGAHALSDEIFMYRTRSSSIRMLWRSRMTRTGSEKSTMRRGQPTCPHSRHSRCVPHHTRFRTTRLMTMLIDLALIVHDCPRLLAWEACKRSIRMLSSALLTDQVAIKWEKVPAHKQKLKVSVFLSSGSLVPARDELPCAQAAQHQHGRRVEERATQTKTRASLPQSHAKTALNWADALHAPRNLAPCNETMAVHCAGEVPRIHDACGAYQVASE